MFILFKQLIIYGYTIYTSIHHLTIELLIERCKSVLCIFSLNSFLSKDTSFYINIHSQDKIYLNFIGMFPITNQQLINPCFQFSLFENFNVNVFSKTVNSLINILLLIKFVVKTLLETGSFNYKLFIGSNSSKLNNKFKY